MMRSKTGMAWAALVLALAFGLRVAPVRAQQGDSGTILGYVFDETGNPLSGVKLTATSDTQIGGAKTTYSDATGLFRFPALIPGAFQVKAEAPNLKSVVQDRVKVGLNAPVELNVVMQIASGEVEEIKVEQAAPLVSTSKANVKEVLDVDLVTALPHDNRDVIFQQVVGYAAGTVTGSQRIRGGANNQTVYTMDGFNMLRQYPTVRATSAFEIQTAGYGAENAFAPGGIVNVVTRSGSNRVEFEIAADADHSAITLGRDKTDGDAT